MKKQELSKRETYLQNRHNMLEDFRSAIEEVQLSEPSVGGEIAGADFQQMSAKSIIMLIKDQEEYIEYAEKHNPNYVDVPEEKVILKKMIKDAKKVFKKDYKAWYKDCK